MTKAQKKERIEELEKMINHNNFINDMYWRERSADNKRYEKELKELVL